CEAAPYAPHRCQPVRIRKILPVNRHFDCATRVGRRDGADQPGCAGSAVDVTSAFPTAFAIWACTASYRARNAAFASSTVSAEPLLGGGRCGKALRVRRRANEQEIMLCDSTTPSSCMRLG